MGRKENPNAIRMGLNKTWDSVWYTDKAHFATFLQEDMQLKKIVREKMKDAV
jgi:small subunit ribosomal protein S3